MGRMKMYTLCLASHVHTLPKPGYQRPTHRCRQSIPILVTQSQHHALNVVTHSSIQASFFVVLVNALFISLSLLRSGTQRLLYPSLSRRCRGMETVRRSSSTYHPRRLRRLARRRLLLNGG